VETNRERMYPFRLCSATRIVEPNSSLACPDSSFVLPNGTVLAEIGHPMPENRPPVKWYSDKYYFSGSNGECCYTSATVDWGSNAGQYRAINGRRQCEDSELVGSALEVAGGLSGVQNEQLANRRARRKYPAKRPGRWCDWGSDLPAYHRGMQNLLSRYVFQRRSNRHSTCIPRTYAFSAIATRREVGIKLSWLTAHPRSLVMSHRERLCALDTWGAS
jgi:hypothetical protein